MKRAPDGTAYEITGGPNRPPVVLIHGLGLSRQLWAEHLSEFEASYHVLNYDLYGHGDSSPPPETASLRIYAKQIADLMDHVGFEKAAIVGFSIGGMINRRFAMDYPEKVTAIAILNSPHDRGEEAQHLVEDRAMKVREQGAMATMDDALKRWFTPSYLATGDGVQKVRDWRAMVDPESYAQTAWVLANGVRELINPNPAIDLPALVMTCENDTGSTPKMSYDIAAEIAGSQTHIVPELQHLGLLEHPGLFTRPVKEFLERVLR